MGFILVLLATGPWKERRAPLLLHPPLCLDPPPKLCWLHPIHPSVLDQQELQDAQAQEKSGEATALCSAVQCSAVHSVCSAVRIVWCATRILQLAVCTKLQHHYLHCLICVAERGAGDHHFQEEEPLQGHHWICDSSHWAGGARQQVSQQTACTSALISYNQ